MLRLDITSEYTALGEDKQNPEYIEQNGRIFAWSESNLNYEHAWWLYATPENDNERKRIRDLLAERVFPLEELHRLPDAYAKEVLSVDR